MRLSCIIGFAAFTLLASASPINSHNRRSNSLWRRITNVPQRPSIPGQPHGHAESSNRPAPLGKHIDSYGLWLKDVLKNEQVVAEMGSAYEVHEFHLASAAAWDPTTYRLQDPAHGLPAYQPYYKEAHFGGFQLRNYYGIKVSIEMGYTAYLALSFLRRDDGKWMALYPIHAQVPGPEYRSNGQRRYYTTSVALEHDGTFVQHVFGEHEVLSIRKHPSEGWLMSSRDPNIEWLARPT